MVLKDVPPEKTQVDQDQHHIFKMAMGRGTEPVR
jgi:hypothetical protein